MASDSGTQGITKAAIVSEVDGPIPCQFNPASFSFSKQNSWKEVQDKGIKDAPKLRFLAGGSASISFELTLDTTDTGKAVTEQTDKLLKLMKVHHDFPAPRPPSCHLLWGSYQSFTAVLQSIELQYTYFASDGTPLRAKAKLSLKQLDDDPKALQNPTSSTPRPHRVHISLPGETLDRIAWKYYGDSNRWRQLAEVNGVTDPLALEPGTSLLVPYAEGMSGGS
jgi:LysM repeat protein